MINLSLDNLIDLLIAACLIFGLTLVQLLGAHAWVLPACAVAAAVSVSYCAAYFWNTKTKAESGQVLGLNLGRKGISHLVGGLPSWIRDCEEFEKVEVSGMFCSPPR